MNQSKLLQQFGVSDGLLKGTAAISSLVTIASISVLPGFGTSGLLIASSIQMLASGLLEIPFGFLADKWSRQKAVLAALVIKIFVTVFLSLAMVSAYFEHKTLVWTFFAAEAIFDAFANSLISGAYQASYLSCYTQQTTQLNITNPKPLFVASYRYARLIRLGLPFAIVLMIGLIQLLTLKIGSSVYFTGFISIAIVLILRWFVLIRVYNDLKLLTPNDYSLKVTYQVPFKWSELNQAFNRYFALYICSIFLQMAALFYLNGLIFKNLEASGIAGKSIWVFGLFLGFGLYTIRTLVASFTYQLVSQIEFGKLIQITLVFKILTVIGLSIIYATFASPLTNLIIISLSIVIILIFTDLIQKSVESNLNVVAGTELKATWLSAGSALGYLSLGIASWIILSTDVDGYLLISVSSVIFCTFLAARFRSKLPNQQSLKTLLRRTSLLITLFVMVLVFLLDLISFTTTSINIQREDERKILESIKFSVKEPLLQGSFIEAARRLQAFNGSQVVSCAGIEVWTFKSGDCDHETSRFIVNYSVPLLTELSNKNDRGTLTVSFDRIDLFKKLGIRFVYSLIAILGLAIVTWTVFSRLTKKINQEFRQLAIYINSSNSNDSNQKFTISDFYDIGQRMNQLLIIEKQAQEKETLGLLSKQVAHDIRSPLTALKSLCNVEVITAEHRHLMNQIVQRIEAIANDILKRNRTDALQKVNVSRLVEDAVVQKQLEQKSAGLVINNSTTSDVVVRAGEPELSRILSNIINNSIEAGSSEVSICLRQDGANFYLDISDNGIGIPKDVLHKIGRENVTFGKSQGFGLGLSYASRLMAFWGGTLTVKNNADKGCTVTLTFPIFN